MTRDEFIKKYEGRINGSGDFYDMIRDMMGEAGILKLCTTGHNYVPVVDREISKCNRCGHVLSD